MKYILPIANSYWIVPGKLLAGEYPGAASETEAREKLRHFLAAGVTFFLDLTESRELAPYAHLLSDPLLHGGKRLTHCRRPIRDVDVPRCKEEMATILTAIDSALADGECVYIHCWGGVGRTGTVVGCYLVRQGMSGEQALRELAARWQNVPKAKRKPLSPETTAQQNFVRQWME
jgi:protein-tyrosine phosphatase